MKKTIIITLRIALGVLFIYGGVQKFISKPQGVKTETASTIDRPLEQPEHIVKIKSFIGGLKQTGYFWEFLGVAELLCGILLLSQVLSLLGAVMLVPVTINIFLFHLFLEPHDFKDLFLTGAYLLVNLAIISYDYPKLKYAFIKTK